MTKIGTPYRRLSVRSERKRRGVDEEDRGDTRGQPASFSSAKTLSNSWNAISASSGVTPITRISQNKTSRRRRRGYAWCVAVLEGSIA